jgi:hypothetical protein
MINIDYSLKKKIDSTLSKEGEVVFVAYFLLEKIETAIMYILSRAVKHHESDELFAPLFACIKELTTNAVKANIKSVLIREGDIKDPNDKLEVINRLKAVLNEKTMYEYALKCVQYNLSVRIYMKFENECLNIKIVNPVPLNDEQYERIQFKIKLAEKYDSIAQFFIENPDPMAEGMGLGLSMVIVMLKSAGIDYRSFSVDSDFKTKTTATMQIPLSI